MEASPLTQQARPDTFRPKVAQLYDQLFGEDEEVEKPEGFWQEFFLLRPDPPSFRKILATLSAEDLLQFQAHPQQLVIRAIDHTLAGKSPLDENALDTLTVFLGSVLNKRYTNPSADIISVLAGLHDADAVFSDFATAIESTMRSSKSTRLRLKAVRAALAMVSGAYSTGLVSYFIHRDLFPALMKLIGDSEHPEDGIEPIILLGLLSNYNKFEFQNPYRLRLDDFVNEAVIKKVVGSAAVAWTRARDAYVAVQDDEPEPWNITNTLSFMGLGKIVQGNKPVTPVLSPEEMKTRFGELPGPDAAFILAIYDFANANKLFCHNLITAPPVKKGDPSPISALLSFSSYLFQHAHRSTRAANYSYLCLFIVQLLLEDQSPAKRICSDESKISVRICRQRAPFLPVVRGDRTVAAHILDVMVDCMNHNLQKRLDVELYVLTLNTLLRLISYLSKTKTRLSYHWSELWRSLLSFVKFLNTYSDDLKSLPQISTLVSNLVSLIALSLSTGESFLPDTAAYDDLFYKLVETGDILTKFRDAYSLSSKQTSDSIDTLISVSRHYFELLEGQGKFKGRGNRTLRPEEVHKIIQEGYESLSIEGGEGLERWERFREVDYRNTLKRLMRIAVEDTKGLLGEGS